MADGGGGGGGGAAAAAGGPSARRKVSEIRAVFARGASHKLSRARAQGRTKEQRRARRRLAPAE